MKHVRTVLDLAFNGYGLSAMLVATDGELLGIADPSAKFDPVPGAVVVRMHLGLAVERLLKAGARFDFFAADVPDGATTPAIGFFTPEPPPQPRHGRRILTNAPTVSTPPPAVISLKIAVELATKALKSGRNGVTSWTPGQRRIFQEAL